jgi:hypothetical protein
LRQWRLTRIGGLSRLLHAGHRKQQARTIDINFPYLKQEQSAAKANNSKFFLEYSSLKPHFSDLKQEHCGF